MFLSSFKTICQYFILKNSFWLSFKCFIALLKLHKVLYHTSALRISKKFGFYKDFYALLLTIIREQKMDICPCIKGKEERKTGLPAEIPYLVYNF